MNRIREEVRQPEIKDEDILVVSNPTEASSDDKLLKRCKYLCQTKLEKKRTKRFIEQWRGEDTFRAQLFFFQYHRYLSERT